MRELADDTGGTFIELPYDGVVDLNEIQLDDWVTSTFTGACCELPLGEYEIVVTATVSGVDTYEGSITFTVNVT